MTRTELTLFAALGTLALFVGTESRQTATAAESHPGGAHGRHVRASVAGDVRLSRTTDDVRHRLESAAAGTYIGEILADRDSALTRWPEREREPLRVWIASGNGFANWSPAYPDQVRSAFAAWSAVGIPVRFAFVDDSASADVHVRWIDHFAEPISGKTLWSRDEHWWIVDADVTLALHHHDGDPLDSAQVRAIALHEIGHLLGLDHTANAANIMAPRVRVRDLSPADQATVRLLYSLPAGAVR